MFGRVCTRALSNRGVPHSTQYSTRCGLRASRSAPVTLFSDTARTEITHRAPLGRLSSACAHSCRRYIQQNAFEPLGIYPPLAANLKSAMMIDEPTELQRSFIPPILQGKDVLIRDTTGSGKTFGILLSLLSKPRRRIGPDSKAGITSVIVVPNQELAFQLQSWTQSLFPTATELQLQQLVQVIVTPSLALPSFSTPEKSLKTATTGRRGLEGASQAADEQVKRLARTLPHVLVATPNRLWDLIQRGVLDLSRIETLVLDEVDHLIRLPKRFASQKEIANRDVHPKPTELAVREILRSAQAVDRYGSDMDASSEEKEASLDRIQLIAASATMNRPMRHWLESNGWVHDPEWVDTTLSVVLPKGIEHHCLVVGAQSIRNMRLESERTPWNQRSGSEGSSHSLASTTTPSETGMKEVDWTEMDRTWQGDKDSTWKERQLTARGVAPELEGATEKFRDDDDRMLEGVATACMLDHVENACVFFCSSYSLNDLATRLEADFGLRVKQIQSAFDPQRPGQEGKQGQVRAKKGIFIAHEGNARGLDVPGLSHVYIVGLPSAPSSYVHMAGRTGRMGKTGQVVTIIRDDEHLEDRARSLFRTLNVAIEPFQHVE